MPVSISRDQVLISGGCILLCLVAATLFNGLTSCEVTTLSSDGVSKVPAKSAISLDIYRTSALIRARSLFGQVKYVFIMERPKDAAIYLGTDCATVRNDYDSGSVSTSFHSIGYGLTNCPFFVESLCKQVSHNYIGIATDQKYKIIIYEYNGPVVFFGVLFSSLIGGLMVIKRDVIFSIVDQIVMYGFSLVTQMIQAIRANGPVVIAISTSIIICIQVFSVSPQPLSCGATVVENYASLNMTAKNATALDIFYYGGSKFALHNLFAVVGVHFTMERAYDAPIYMGADCSTIRDAYQHDKDAGSHDLFTSHKGYYHNGLASCTEDFCILDMSAFSPSYIGIATDRNYSVYVGYDTSWEFMFIATVALCMYFRSAPRRHGSLSIATVLRQTMACALIYAIVEFPEVSMSVIAGLIIVECRKILFVY